MQSISTFFWALPLVLGLTEEKHGIQLQLMEGYHDNLV